MTEVSPLSKSSPLLAIDRGNDKGQKAVYHTTMGNTQIDLKKLNKLTLVIEPGKIVDVNFKSMGLLSGKTFSFENLDTDVNAEPRIVRIYIDNDRQSASVGEGKDADNQRQWTPLDPYGDGEYTSASAQQKIFFHQAKHNSYLRDSTKNMIIGTPLAHTLKHYMQSMQDDSLNDTLVNSREVPLDTSPLDYPQLGTLSDFERNNKLIGLEHDKALEKYHKAGSDLFNTADEYQDTVKSYFDYLHTRVSKKADTSESSALIAQICIFEKQINTIGFHFFDQLTDKEQKLYEASAISDSITTEESIIKFKAAAEYLELIHQNIHIKYQEINQQLETFEVAMSKLSNATPPPQDIATA